MAIEIKPYTLELVDGVKQFNSRLHAGGSTRSFYEDCVSGWLPKERGREIFQEYFLAIEDDSIVRGGYVLKSQLFSVKGEVRSIGFISNPISEGIVDKEYSLVPLQLIRGALGRQPFLLALGMGGNSYPLPVILMRLGWSLEEVPFYFRVVHANRFFNNITYLRKKLARNILFGLLGATGLGRIAVQAIQGLNQSSESKFADIEYEIVPRFGVWADDLWRLSHGEYPLIALRDSLTLNILYPEKDGQFLRIKASRNNKVVGWSVVLDTQMENHKQFGNMRVGSVIDCLATPENSFPVIKSATQFLETRGVDIIVSNQSHESWCQSLKTSGFIRGPSNFFVAASRGACEAIFPFEENKGKMHLNRGDGDGPIHL